MQREDDRTVMVMLSRLLSAVATTPDANHTQPNLGQTSSRSGKTTGQKFGKERSTAQTAYRSVLDGLYCDGTTALLLRSLANTSSEIRFCIYDFLNRTAKPKIVTVS